MALNISGRKTRFTVMPWLAICTETGHNMPTHPKNKEHRVGMQASKLSENRPSNFGKYVPRMHRQAV